MTPRERLVMKLQGFKKARADDPAFKAEMVVEALDDYLDSKKGQTLRDRLMSAVGVAYAEARTDGGDRRREETLDALLNDGWAMDRIAGILERT